MKVAAYQAPLEPSGSLASVEHIRKQVLRCEQAGVQFLCCPEGILGGLADNALNPHAFAFDLQSGALEKLLAPIASDRVTTIVGFTETNATGALYNSAAVFHQGAVLGVYRKLHPAIRKSVYQAGTETPVFRVGDLTFGIVICYDSNFSEPVKAMATMGATVLFVPSNNALRPNVASVVVESRAADCARARDGGMWVVRADVVGNIGSLVAHGASSIVDNTGTVRHAARLDEEDLLIADIGDEMSGITPTLCAH